jgi:hypothetical protein
MPKLRPHLFEFMQDDHKFLGCSNGRSMTGFEFAGWQACSCPALPKMVGMLEGDSAARELARLTCCLINKPSIAELSMTVNPIPTCCSHFLAQNGDENLTN